MLETKVGCAIILFDPADPATILVGKRSRKKSHPGTWELIGGTLEEGEQPEECIRREVREELGAEVSALRQIKPLVLYRDRNRYIVFNFTGTPAGSIRLCQDELEEVRWVTRKEADRLDLFPGCRETIEAYFDTRGSS
jgi:8-oxo-dGTP diphosphatase